MYMRSFIVALSLVSSFATLADQCQYITAESAQTAVKLISQSKKATGGILELCQLCGETSPTELKVNQIDLRSTGVSEAPIEININGSGIDLAYTYVNINKGTWVNLAKLSNCSATDASLYIIEKTNKDGTVKYQPSSIK